MSQFTAEFQKKKHSGVSNVQLFLQSLLVTMADDLNYSTIVFGTSTPVVPKGEFDL